MNTSDVAEHSGANDCYPPDADRFAATIALRLFRGGYTNFSDHGPIVDLIRDVLTERHAVASITRITCPDCGAVDLPCDVFDGGRGVSGLCPGCGARLNFGG